MSGTIRRAFAALALLAALPLGALAQSSVPDAPSPATSEAAPAAMPGALLPEGAVPLEDAAAVADGALLPHDLSPWGMFMGADVVVKAVMIGLALASVITWTVLFAKSLELARAGRRQRATLGVVRAARSLGEAAQRMEAQRPAIVPLIETARAELRMSADALHDREGLKERVAAGLERAEAEAARRMTRGTSVLATIGATAPFVGLFGTVWGIMNSFIGISKAQTTNLAVVAPGIAEALLATALGLVAAIPAVVIYNHFARRIAAYKALVADGSAAVMALVSRDLSRGLYEVAEVRKAEAAE